MSLLGAFALTSWLASVAAHAATHAQAARVMWLRIALLAAFITAMLRLATCRLAVAGWTDMTRCELPTMGAWVMRSGLETVAVVGPLVFCGVLIWRSRPVVPHVEIETREAHDYRTSPQRENLVQTRAPFTWRQRLTLVALTLTALAAFRETSRDLLFELFYSRAGAKSIAGTYDGQRVFQLASRPFRFTLALEGSGHVEAQMGWPGERPNEYTMGAIRGRFVENHGLFAEDSDSRHMSGVTLCTVKSIYIVGDELIGTEDDGTESLRGRRVATP